MIILGLTGSIGMGKSTTAKLFADQGVPVFDADAQVHHLYQQDETVISAINAQFPQAVKGGKVDRAALGELVRTQKGTMQKLEAIIHPAIAQRRQRWLDEMRDKEEKIVLFDIPLLFETGGEKNVDYVIVVSTTKGLQKQRVMEREGMSEARFSDLLSRQMPDAEKCKRADFVINTSISLEDVALQVQSILNQIRSEKPTGKCRS
jgi:dephospho-CoA kinase